MGVNIKRGTLLGAMTALAVGLFGSAGSASAGVLVQTTSNCSGQALSQPFARWLDYGSYELVPNGNLESGGKSWLLAGGAKVVAGNESFKVAGAGDASSLLLPNGSSATTAPLCVGLDSPTLRFFARKNSGLLSTLAVSAVLRLEGGGTLTVPVGVVAAGGSWTPTLPYLFLGNLLPLLPGQYTPVSFRFTPLLGSWQVDDVYVDPFRRA
jgi:hypothetical protein